MNAASPIRTAGAHALRCGAFVGVLLAAGCTATGRSWAAHWPEGGQIAHAAGKAIRDPHTWIPVAAAAVFVAADLDDGVSEHATDNGPLFGNPHKASDTLRDVGTAAYFLTALAAPSASWRDKAGGLAGGIGTILLTSKAVDAMKSASGRTRPAYDDDRSFPSGHASWAAVATRLAQHNLDYIEMPPWRKNTLDVGLYGVAVGAAWARVEAGKHYPSDVLVGYAVGSFFATFFQEAFMSDGGNARLTFTPIDRGGALTFTLVGTGY